MSSIPKTYHSSSPNLRNNHVDYTTSKKHVNLVIVADYLFLFLFDRGSTGRTQDCLHFGAEKRDFLARFVRDGESDQS